MDQMEHSGTGSKSSLMDNAMVGGQPVDLRSDLQSQGQPPSSGSFIVVNSSGVLSAGVGGGGASSLGRPGTGAMSPADQLQPPPRSASSVVTGGGRMTQAVVGRPAGSPAAVTRLFIPSNQMRSLGSVVSSGVGGGAQPLRVVATAPVSSSVATSISFQPHQQFVGSPPVGRFRMVAPATSGLASPGRSIIVGAQSQRLSLLSSPRKILATGEIPRLSSSPHRIVIRPSATIGPNKILRVVGATTASPGRSLLAPLPKSSGAAPGSHLQHQLGVPLHTVVASASSASLTGSSAPSPGAIKTLQRRLLPGASLNYSSAATAPSIGLESASARPLGDPGLLPLSAPMSSMTVPPGVSRSGSVGVASRARSNDASVTDILRTATKYAVQIPKDNPQPEVPGLRPRKPCNCTKSQCLKLYCDCFAAGEFCNNCNCTNCYNSLQHEEDRQRAVRQCLDRNPQAFKPKIGKSDNETRKHQKGCHCKKSGCLKNYCECYEAKIFCSSQCKCVGCRNCESTRSAGPRSMAVSTLLDDRISAVAGSSGAAGMRRDAFPDDSMVPTGDQPFGHLQLMGSVFGPQRQQSIRVTQSVIDAALMCLMAESCQPLDTERRILMEFGRCLSQIIDYGTRRPGSSTSSTEPGRV